MDTKGYIYQPECTVKELLQKETERAEKERGNFCENKRPRKSRS